MFPVIDIEMGVVSGVLFVSFALLVLQELV